MKWFPALLFLAACEFQISATGQLPGIFDAADAPPVIDAPPDADVPPIDATPPIDAPSIDAPPDAPPAWMLVEVIAVPCTGTSIVSQTVLATGTMYELRATGSCSTSTRNNARADAEYLYNYIGGPDDSYDDIDTGIAIDDITPGASKLPDWGSYQGSHAYDADWMGLGAPITVQYHEANTGNNSGELRLEIHAFQ